MFHGAADFGPLDGPVIQLLSRSYWFLSLLCGADVAHISANVSPIPFYAIDVVLHGRKRTAA